MEGDRRWLGWAAIGLAGLALLVALGGRGFGPQAVMGMRGGSASQAYAQQGGGQFGSEGRSNPLASGAYEQQGARWRDKGPQPGPAASGPNTRRGEGWRSNGGFGLGGWFHFPFTFFGGLSRLGLAALLIVLGVWLIRGRSGNGVHRDERATPAQAPPEQQSPTGESYTDQPDDQA